MLTLNMRFCILKIQDNYILKHQEDSLKIRGNIHWLLLAIRAHQECALISAKISNPFEILSINGFSVKIK